MFFLGLILSPVGLLTAVFGAINVYNSVTAESGLSAYGAGMTVAGLLMMIGGIALLFFGYRPARQGRAKERTENELALASFEIAVITLLQIIKTVFFYNYVGIGYHTFTLLAASIFMLTVYLGIGASNNEKPPLGYSAVLYYLSSIAMFIDVIYYKQFTRIPSFMAFKQRIFVDDVSDSVISLISFTNVLYIADLFIIAAYFIFIRKKIKDKYDWQKKLSYEKIKKLSKKLFKTLLPVTSGIVAAIILFTGFTFSNLRNEFVIFHVFDAARTAYGIKTTESDYLGTLKTDYTDSALHGAAKGKDLMVIQVESLQSFVIGRSYNGVEITPNLNKLIKESIYLENHYFQTGGGNTSDAEFTINNSLLAPQFENGYMKYTYNTFYGLPWILKENGFSYAAAFHGYSAYFWGRENAYPNQGFDKYYSGEMYEMNTRIGMGISDGEFLDQTVNYLKELSHPYYAFVITLTSHFPFTYQFENVFIPQDEEAKYNQTFVDYLACVHYTDECLGKFFEDLKSEGMYDDTVIALYGDHFALSINDEEMAESMENILGKPYDYDEFFKVPAIIHVPGAKETEGLVISHASGHADMMPTLLDLFGYKSDHMIIAGQNMLAAESGIVYPQASVERSSFFSDDTVYIVPQNNISSNIIAYDKQTGKTVNAELCKETAEYGLKLYSDCAYLLDNDLIAEFLNKGRDHVLKEISKK